MQKILATLAFVFLPSVMLLAQDGGVDKINTNATPPPIVKPSRDFLMIQLSYNNWIKKPDSIKTKPFNYVLSTYLCYDFPIKKTKLSFAAGLGMSMSVNYLDKQVIAVSDTGALSASARFLTDTMSYKRYKFVTAYLQAPFELRYYSNINNRNTGFKAAIGLQVGTLFGAHTKGLRSVSGTNVKDKINTKRYLSPWNFAATARVGYGHFSLFASYNLTNIYKENAGPPITPASVGLCITGL